MKIGLMQPAPKRDCWDERERIGQRLKVSLSLLCLSRDRSLKHMLCVAFVDLFCWSHLLIYWFMVSMRILFCTYKGEQTVLILRGSWGEVVTVFFLIISLIFSYLLVVISFGHHVIAYNSLVVETSSSKSSFQLKTCIGWVRVKTLCNL